MNFSIQSNSTDETQTLGFALGRLILQIPLNNPFIVALSGTLGAGKTLFSTSCCTALGVNPLAISSPTFSLQNQYSGTADGITVPINHFDFYRFKDEDEIFGIGFDETISQPGVHLIEWADKFIELIGQECLQIRIQSPQPTVRILDFYANGEEPTKVLNLFSLEVAKAKTNRAN